MNSIDNVLESLCDMRSAEKFHKLFECISVIAELLEVTLIKPRTAMHSVYRAAAGGADVSVEDYYRITVYYPTIHNIMKDVELRFGPVQKKAATLASVVPGFMKIGITDDEEWEHVQDAVNVYYDLLPDPMTVVMGEYRLWHRKWQAVDIAERPQAVLSALDHCTAYPNVSLLLQLLATIPVTTAAEAERLFSKLERTLTAIRSTMDERRLEALILLPVHRSDTPTVDDVIDRFATTAARRLDFVL